MRDWREQLEEVVMRGRAAEGDAAVRDALDEAFRRLGPAADAVAPLTPPIAVLGLEGCAAGWVGVLIRPSGQITLHLGAAIGGLVEQIREQDDLGVVGISALAAAAAEVETWRQSRSSLKIIEVEPGSGFARIGGDHAIALDERRDSLASVGVAVPSMYSGMGFDEAELLNACVVAWTVADHFS